MGLKTLANTVTSKIGRQVLVAQKHSPVFLFTVGLVGVGTTAVLACRATLKMSDVLEEGEANKARLEHATTMIEAGRGQELSEEDHRAFELTSFGIQLQTAIKVAKLYAPAILVGIVSTGALTGSHVILSRRNAGLTAAYAVVHKGFEEYRARVVADQGAEKDFEYRHGITQREIVEEGPNGPEVKVIKGLDADEIKKNASNMYQKVFDEWNPNWSNVPSQNPYFLQSMQNHANNLLQVKGKVYLNDVYDMLGIEREEFGQVVGWVKNSGKGDGYIDFGVWNGSTFNGKEWVKGNVDGILLDFNVDGVILDLLKEKRSA